MSDKARLSRVRWVGIGLHAANRADDPAPLTLAFWMAALRPHGARLRDRAPIAELTWQLRLSHTPVRSSLNTPESLHARACVNGLTASEGYGKCSDSPRSHFAAILSRFVRARPAEARTSVPIPRSASWLRLRGHGQHPAPLTLTSMRDCPGRDFAVMRPPLRASRNGSLPWWRRTWLARLMAPRGQDVLAFQFLSAVAAKLPRAASKTFGSLSLSNADQRKASAPDEAGLIYLALVYKYVSTDQPDHLPAVLANAKSTAYSTALINGLTAYLGQSDLDEDEEFALHLFLGATTVRPLHPSVALYFQFNGLKIAELRAHDLAAGDTKTVDGGRRIIVDQEAPVSVLGQMTPADLRQIICLGPSRDMHWAGKPDGTLARAADIRTAASLRIRPYSESEEALSQCCAEVAEALVGGIAAILGPDRTPSWIEALELPIDDLLFAAAIDMWSILQYLATEPAAETTFLAGTSDMALAYAAGHQAFGVSGACRLIVADNDFTPEEHAADLLDHLVQCAFPAGDDMQTRLAHDSLVAALNIGAPPTGSDLPRPSTLLIGRNFDRNYSTDLVELGREMRRSDHVVFMPTAGQAVKGRISTFIDGLVNDWSDSVITTPAASLWNWAVQPLSAKSVNLLPLLIDHAIQNGLLELRHMALILAARARLEPFLRKKVYNYLKAGEETVNSVTSVAPTRIALLPGRDFIARVAAITGRQQDIPSYDVQTVFVGPRSRYKPTLANIQFTIETHSQGLFTSYFGLPLERTALTGCSKVGVVQDKARKLDRTAVRRSVGLENSFLLVFAGSPFLEEDQLILSAIAASLADIADGRLGIRLHPTAEDGYAAFCEDLCGRHPGVTILSSIDLAQTMVASDILITRFSNVGLETALLGIDVIACNFSGGAPPIDLDEMGVAAAVFSPEDLHDCIADMREHGPRWRALQQSRGDYISRNAQLVRGPAAANMRQFMDARAPASASV